MSDSKELTIAFRSVLARSLTDDERVAELEKMGFSMCKRTFERRKRHFREDIQFRLDSIQSKEFASFYIDAIDKMTIAAEKMMKLLDSADVETQFQASRELRENLRLLCELFDAKTILNGTKHDLQKQTITN